MFIYIKLMFKLYNSKLSDFKSGVMICTKIFKIR